MLIVSKALSKRFAKIFAPIAFSYIKVINLKAFYHLERRAGC
jgi:hypothetical protein